MTASQTAPREQSDLDQQLADVLAEIAARLQAGQSVDLSDYVRRCPEHADRIEQLLPAMKTLAELGRSRSSVRSSVAGAAEPVGSVEGTLGDFRILREIGRGGMGVVYEAQQISLGRRVALKVLPFAVVLDPRHLQRFKNEAQAAAALEHPNIVNVHAVGCERGVHYYAMQYIDGQTLAQVIEELRQRGEGGGWRVAGGATRPPAADAPPDSSPLAPVGEGPGVRAAAPKTEASLAATIPLTPEPRTPNPEPSPVTPSPPQPVAPSLPVPDTLAAISTHRSHRTREFFRSFANLGIQAADALEYAHQMGVVHRDIKPSNLMVSSLPSPSGRRAGGEGPHLCITDFGLAQISAPSPLGGEGRGEGASLTLTGDILGTLRYMSPEQAAGRSRVLDHHTDIYSLGLTLYELLTLRPAFEGDDRQQLLCKIVADDPPPPRQHNPSIPRDLETIVLKATAKEPSHRYATAQEMADDLRRYLDDKPIRAKRPSLVERGAKWARRHKPVVWSAAATLAVCVLALAGSLALIAAAYEGEKEQRQIADRQLIATEKAERLANQQAQLAKQQESLAKQQQQVANSQKEEAIRQRQEAQTMFLLALQDLRPSGAAFGPDGNLYVGSNGTGAVLQFSGATGRFLRVFVEPGSGGLGSAEGIVFGPDANDDGIPDLFVACRATASVLCYDGRTGAFLRTFISRNALAWPTGLVFGPNGDLYVMNSDDNRVLRYDGHSGNFLGVFVARGSGGLHCPKAGVFGPDGNLYVTSLYTDNVLRYDGKTGKYLGEFVPARSGGLRFPEGLAFGPDGRLYVLSRRTYQGPSSVLRYDGKAGAFLGEFIARGAGGIADAQALVFGPDGSVFITSFGTDAVVRFDGATGNFIDPFARYDRRQLLRVPRAPGMMFARSIFETYLDLAEFQETTGDHAQAKRSLDDLIAQLRRAATVSWPCTELTFLLCDAYRRRGDNHVNRGEIESAIGDYTQAFSFRPFHKIYAERGEALLLKGDLDKALADFDAAIPIDPQWEWPHVCRAWVRFRQQRADQAIADYSAAIRRQPRKATAYYLRGDVYALKGDLDRASADFSKAAEVGPDEVLVWHYKALEHLAQRKLSDYRKTCAGMLARFAHAESPEQVHYAAWTWALTPDAVWNWPKALVLAEQAVQSGAYVKPAKSRQEPAKSRRQPKAELETLGAVLYRAGRLDDAIHRFTEAESLSADLPYIGLPTRSPAYSWFFLAMAHHRLGHTEEAKKWLDKAVQQADKELRDRDPRTGQEVSWNRRVTLKLLRAEAESLIKGPAGQQPKTVPEGKEKPEGKPKPESGKRNSTEAQAVQPEGLEYDSPGQRPGAGGPFDTGSPERAKCEPVASRTIPPLQGGRFGCVRVPRALPWAVV